jgi:30S ribosomal protein S31
MGRGDKRTRRGKIFKASYGNVRAKATKSGVGARSKTTQAGTAAKKAPVAKKTK